MVVSGIDVHSWRIERIADQGWDIERNEKEELLKYFGCNLLLPKECENPPKMKRFFDAKFTPYPHYIVFGFEVFLEGLNQFRPSDLLYITNQTPVNVAIHDDSLTGEPSFTVQ